MNVHSSGGSASPNRARAAALLCFIATSPASAQPGNYGPFGPDEHNVAALAACEGVPDVRGGPSPQATLGNVPPEEGRIEYTRPGLDARLRITIEDQAFEAQVFVVDQPRSAPIAVSAVMSLDLGNNAVCDDLNHDGVTDFITTIWGHGNGLGAAYYHRFVALSDGPGYRFWTLETMWPDSEDLVTFGRIEPIAMVTRDIVQTHGPVRYFGSGPDRSYFVHDLWAFHGGEVVSVNSIDARFPVWVRYTYTPNHLPAKSVDANEKLKLRPAPQTPVEIRP